MAKRELTAEQRDRRNARERELRKHREKKPRKQLTAEQKERRLEKQRLRRALHPGDERRYREKYAAQIRELRRKNKAKYADKKRVQSRRWREQNREKLSEQARAWANSHRATMRETQRRYAAKNPEKWRGRKLAPGQCSAADIARLFNEQRGLCTVCCVVLIKTGKGKYHVDHIMPVRLGGSNDPANLQLLCPSCNHRKGAKHPDEWAKIIGSIGDSGGK